MKIMAVVHGKCCWMIDKAGMGTRSAFTFIDHLWSWMGAVGDFGAGFTLDRPVT